MDDIVDYTEEAADFLGLYKIEAPMAQAQALTKVLVAACEQLADGLEHLREFKDLDKYWIEIHRLENEGDRISRDAVASLFSNGIDPMVVIRWKDMFAVLENAIDATETLPRSSRASSSRTAELVSSDVILVIVVGTALAFDFTNGFHDTANVVATSISTGAARPQVAIGVASLLNFVGAFISISVAATVANDVVNAAVITPDGRLRRPDRGDRLEPDHLVLRPALELLARADRRRGRLGGGGRRASTRCSPTAWSARC